MSQPPPPDAEPGSEARLYGVAPARRWRIPHLHQLKARGERWAMLTSYDMLTAAIFDEAGIPVLLVGDSAGNSVFGYDSTLPVTVDELLPLVRAVVRHTQHAMVVGDLPFGSYQASPEQAVLTAVRFMKEGGAHAVKLEGGRPVMPQVRALAEAGIPVMAHLGFTPQSEHQLGGYRVQGRGDHGDVLVADALALQEAGAFAIVLEMIPAEVAARISTELRIPTIGIGAGVHCDAQVLVWTDMAGLTPDPAPAFVKRYAHIRSLLHGAAREFATEVAGGSYPAPEHSYS
jgi:3-methyl-2-oxobutanoate hydroxymethyltransferase